MSILIKGLKMPKEGQSVVVDLWNHGKAYVYGTGNAEMYEAVELPDHERLIDAKSISEKIDNIWDGRPLSLLGCEILAMIDKEPTVIDADRSEDERTD